MKVLRENVYLLVPITKTRHCQHSMASTQQKFLQKGSPETSLDREHLRQEDTALSKSRSDLQYPKRSKSFSTVRKIKVTTHLPYTP